MRLIHAGRLLTDSTQLASWLSTLEERQQRAAEKDKEGTDSSIAPTAPGPSSVLPWLLHCSVGPPLSEGEEDDDAQAQVRRRDVVLFSILLLTTLWTAAPSPATRRHKSSHYAALIDSPLQASPKMISSTSGDSSTRVPSQTTSPQPSFPLKKNVRPARFTYSPTTTALTPL